MKPEEQRQLESLLNQPDQFNARFTRGGWFVEDWMLPQGEYRDLIFKSFQFKKIKFEEGSRFENVVFDACVFDNTVFVNSRFTKCKFNNCLFVRSRFLGLKSSQSEYKNTRFEDTDFGDDKAMSSEIHSGLMDSVVFSSCRFQGMTFDSIQHKSLVWEKDKWIDANVFNMEIIKGNYVSPKIGNIDFMGCVFKGYVPDESFLKSGAMFSLCALDGIALKTSKSFWKAAVNFGLANSAIEVSSDEKDVYFGGGVKTSITGGTHLNQYMLSGQQYSESKISNANGRELLFARELVFTDTHLEDLDFEEIEWDHIVFTRCTLKNIRARKSLVLDSTRFVDCKFENFTLDPGGSYSAQGTPYEKGLPR